MKRIALLLTALVGLIVASCGDDNTEPPVVLYGKYAAEKVTITENGNTFTAPGEVTLTKYDSEQSDKAKLTINSFPPFDSKVILIVSIKEEQDIIYFTGDFHCGEEYEGNSGFKGTASGTCTSEKINITLNYSYNKLDDTSIFVGAYENVDVELSEKYFNFSGSNQETVNYNGKDYSRKDLLNEAKTAIIEILREKIGGMQVGFDYLEDGILTPYWRTLPDPNTGQGLFKGKFRMIFSNMAADEEGARSICKKLFGKDEIIPELYSQKLGNYYLVNIETIKRNGTVYPLSCPKLDLKFWRNFLLENGKEHEADILSFLIENSYNPQETLFAWAV